MISVEMLSADAEDRYLEYLNRCFAPWGGGDQFLWTFKREAGGPASDMMVLSEAGQVLAGSAVTYRRLALPNGRTTLAGIMTGSWTLPEARGRGCFSRVIEESVSLTARQGGSALLAFVTQTNSSFRRLEHAGAALFDTYYCVSAGATPAAGPALEVREMSLESVQPERLFLDWARAREGTVHVSYDLEAWRGQILDRPAGTRVLDFQGAGWAVVEPVGDTDRVQAVVLEDEESLVPAVRALLQWSRARGRKLFFFSTVGSWRDAAVALELEVIPGFLCVLAADTGRLQVDLGASARWTHPTSRVLSAPESEWYLGPWDLQSGDRM